MVRLFSLVDLFLASAIFFCAATATNVTAPIVDLGYAQYQGYFDTDTNMTSFLGIRYAAAPTGGWRFQAPQLPVPVSGVQSATQNPDMCYQAGEGANVTGSATQDGLRKRQSVTPAPSEDCLFLNVFVPGTIVPKQTEGLPVLVWIHGGGYMLGYAAEFDGADLVNDSLNTVIVVVIQYRLGVFGFLSGNEVKAGGALNAGLLDQTFALEWVQDHIEVFGGDKGHVTIWGESAGAGSVLQHIVANEGNTHPPLFNAAMTSSTYLPPQYQYNDSVPQSLYDEVVSLTGCGSDEDTFTCLQSLNVETLESANTNIGASVFYGTFAFVPVVDGTFIVERPTVTLAKGKVNGQILLSVTNKQEGTPFVDTNEMLTITDYVHQLFPDMTPETINEAALVYRDYGSALEQAILVMGDTIFVCPTYYLLKTFAGRAWKGLFAIPPAYHGEDVIYYFYSPSDPPPFDNTQFIDAFSRSFLSLAKNYDVNDKVDPTTITPEWTMYTPGGTEMLFNRTGAEPVVRPIRTDPKLLQRCEFWSTVTNMTAQ